MNNTKALETLVLARDILNKLEVPYFLAGGTLLGFMRSGDFIKSDDEDIDVGIMITDFKDSILPTFIEAGFKLERELGDKIHGYEYSFRRDGIQLDLMFYYKEKDYFYHGAWFPYRSKWELVKYQHYIKDFGEITVLGETFRIPSSADEILEHMYGEDWAVSAKEWHWCMSPRNIIDTEWLTKKKKVCLNMIVKNESKVIERCLNSIKDVIDYWVIVDTGSTDDTKEKIWKVLKHIPGELHEREWKNFGYNRTEAIQLAQYRGDYLLMIDADNVFKFTKPLDKTKLVYDAYDILQINPSVKYYYTMILSTACNWKSVGVTHEYYACPEKTYKEKLDGVEVVDFADGGCRKNKMQRDIELLEQGLKDEPNNRRYKFYLAQSYKGVNEFEEAIKWYQERVNAKGWDEEVYYSLMSIGSCYLYMKKGFEDISEALLTAYHYRPSRLEALYMLVKYCKDRKKFSVGYEVGKSAVHTPYPSKDILFITYSVYDYEFLDEWSLCAFYSGHKKEALEAINIILEKNKFPESQRARLLDNKLHMEGKK